MRLVAYLRVSTIEQAEHGYGIDAQRAAIRSAARKLGARIVQWCDDEGLSGTLEAADRPGLTEALAMIRNAKADGLIIRDLDRLARAVSVQEAVLGEVWCNEGAGVYTSNPVAEVARDDPDDPMRTAMRQMHGVFVELDRRMIVKRLKDGRTAKAAIGGHVGGRPPYGWRAAKKSADNPNGALVPVPLEQEAIAEMVSLAAQGVAHREIAKRLEAKGYPTKRGGPWSHGTVARILKTVLTKEAKAS